MTEHINVYMARRASPLTTSLAAAAPAPPPKPSRARSVCQCSDVLPGACYGRSECPPASEAPLDDTVELVVAHCSRSMPWLGKLSEAIAKTGLRLARIHVVSKCAWASISNNAFVVQGVQDFGRRHGVDVNIINVANVGRCDHSWAFFIADRYHTLPGRLLMLKDSWTSRTSFAATSADSLLESMKTSGFACAYHRMDHGSRVSPVWHSIDGLKTFAIKRYSQKWDQSGNGSTHRRNFEARQRPLGTWWSSLQLPHDLDSARYRPVCYGGGFATTRAAIQRVPQSAWARIVLSLSRGDNIEESHYMERSWAALLTLPLQARWERAMACATRAINMSTVMKLRGGYQKCPCADVESCAT